MIIFVSNTDLGSILVCNCSFMSEKMIFSTNNDHPHHLFIDIYLYLNSILLKITTWSGIVRK